MVSGLFSAKTVVHLSTTPATASFEHAVAVCTETPALNTSTTALIARRVCIIFLPHLFGYITHIRSLRSLSPGRQDSDAGGCDQTMRLLRADELAPLHSITSSASATNLSGIRRPNAFAVLRLITISNLVGCWTGRSAGLVPLKILST